MGMFIDVHCHLEMLKDLDKIIKEDVKKDVGIIVWNGVNREVNRQILEFCFEHKEVRAALGIYPIDALKLSDEEIDEEIEFIKENKKRIVAIGEVGLDYKEDLKQKERQKEIFRKFIKLAIELNKPIIVHSRKAEEDAVKILEKMKAKKVIVHCFMGNFSLVDRISNNGWTFTIPGIIKNSEHFQEIVKRTNIGQILCETDSPFLHPDKKFPNFPENVIENYEIIAKIRNIGIKEVEKQLEENYKKLFGN